MKAIDLVQETAAALNSNRARSLLTVLGVVIGIAAVIAMTALIGGLKQSLVGEMGLNQARTVQIACSYGQGLTLSDMNEMKTGLDEYYESVEPTTYGSAEVVSQSKKASGSIRGTGITYPETRGSKLAQGRYFNQREYDGGAQVVVLETSGLKTLFGSEQTSAVGRVIRIGDGEYEIVGVVQSDESLGDSSVSVYMPFTTCAQRIVGDMSVGTVIGLTRAGVDPQVAADAAKDWLVKRFRIPETAQEESVYVITMKSIIDQVNSLMAAFQTLMVAVSSISLLVGGIGIMNMMLTNVTERIREIGLRKALGARRRDITRQFLLESICITMAGGVIGILLGYAGSFGLAGLAGGALGSQGLSITPTIDFGSVLMVAGICIAVGVIFGYYPARRAAKLDPVESLRYQ